MEGVTADLIWEHFQEGDDRLRIRQAALQNRSGAGSDLAGANGAVVQIADGRYRLRVWYCDLARVACRIRCMTKAIPAPRLPIMAPSAFRTAFPCLTSRARWFRSNSSFGGVNPYASESQSTQFAPHPIRHRADIQGQKRHAGINAEWQVTPSLTFNSETGYNAISCGPRKTTTASTPRRDFPYS